MNKVAAVVSFLASCFVIILIVILKKWKFIGQRLMLYLTITALLVSVASILHRIDFQKQTSSFYNGFCMFGGFFTQVTAWMLLNSIVSTTVHLLMTVIHNKQIERYEWFHIFSIFILPFALNWIPFIKLTYGKAGAWCWIKSYEESTCKALLLGQWLQFILWYVPLYTILGIIALLYVTIVIKIKKKEKKWTGVHEPNKKQLKAEVLHLLAYPLIYFALSILPFVNHIYTSVNPAKPKIFLWYLSAILSPSQGTIIAILFIVDSRTRKRLTWIAFRAAVVNFFSRKKVPEYAIKECMSDSMQKTAKVQSSYTATDPVESQGNGRDKDVQVVIIT